MRNKAMKLHRSALCMAMALGLGAAGQASATGVLVYDAANLAAKEVSMAFDTVNMVSNVATAAKMHGVLDNLDGVLDKLDQIAHVDVKNDYHCEVNIGDGGGTLDNDYICSGTGGSGPEDPGEVIIPIPVREYGLGQFGGHASSHGYMDESRSVLDELAQRDTGRFTAVMDINAAQALTLEAQVDDFNARSEHMDKLRSEATKDMSTRMQAAYANQLAAAQVGEAMQMRALMLADQNAQVIRAQEAAAHQARQAVAEKNLRVIPNTMGEGQVW